MKVYIYETLSVAFQGGGVEVVVVVAENREAADQVMLRDANCGVCIAAYLENVYKVEEKALPSGAVIFRANVLERLS